MSETPHLFSPLTLRNVTLKNRIVLSPLCMYCATDGVPDGWHFSHLSAFARGGASVVFTEATAVEARGRISPGCLGIWNDAQMEAYRPITKFIADMGAIPAMQIAHAGRKAAVRPPWEGSTPLTDQDVGDRSWWKVVGPSANPVADGWQTPHELDQDEIREIVAAFAAGARRAHKAGFRILEIHGAHGYLIHSFLSPIANRRTDSYGGDLAGRMRFALEVTDAVRAAWPDDLPLFFRISSVDGPPEGWSLDDSVILARELAARGVDIVDCSGGGIAGAPHFRSSDSGAPLKTSRDRPPGFQVPYAEKIRREAGVKSMAVGVITDPHQAEAILADGRADLVALGRELMYNPFWPLHAAEALGCDPDFKLWPDQYGWAVVRRAELANDRAEDRADQS